MLFVILLWLALEVYCYWNFRKRAKKLRMKQYSSRCSELNSWVDRTRPLIPDLDHQQLLEQRILPYEAGKSMINPHYKPLPYYLFLRGVYYGGSLIGPHLGWKRTATAGLVYWEKGTGPTLLFLHGFGLGPLPYYQFLNRISTRYHVVVPEYPGICYDGCTELPGIAEFAETVLPILPQQFHIVSNSFGTTVHSYLLLRHPHRIISQVFTEPVCFYAYCATVLNFIELQFDDIRRCPNKRTQSMMLVSYFLAAKDINVQSMCQVGQFELFWDAEQHIDQIPTTLVLSAEDYLIDSSRLADYFQSHHPTTRIIIIPEAQHGQSLFGTLALEETEILI